MDPHGPPFQRPRKPTGRNCEHCGQPVDATTQVEVTVPDSTYLHPDDPQQDGRRPAYACSPGHADDLVARGVSDWIDEQLWASKLRRVSGHWNRSETTLSGIAARAGLTHAQLTRAIDWRTGPSNGNRERDRPAPSTGNTDR